MARLKGSLNLSIKPICGNNHNVSICGKDKRNKCNDCRREYSTQWANDHPEYISNRNWRRQGIINQDGTPFTTINRDYAYQVQQGKCKICGIHESDLNKPLFADHDHKTGKFRGLLCQGCNIKVGVVESKEHNLVIKYLGGY